MHKDDDTAETFLLNWALRCRTLSKQEAFRHNPLEAQNV